MNLILARCTFPPSLQLKFMAASASMESPQICVMSGFLWEQHSRVSRGIFGGLCPRRCCQRTTIFRASGSRSRNRR